MNENPPKKKILLAEDDSSMRRFVEVMLQRDGYEVVVAEDGLAALRIALETEVDLIVADAMMPNMGGYDLCRMMRQNPAKKHIPLVILSGLEQDGAADADCLADAYVLKGADLKEQLAGTLSRLLPQTIVS